MIPPKTKEKSKASPVAVFVESFRPVMVDGDETVKTHVGHVLSKLGVENRAQAMVQATKRGLVSLDELE